MITSPKDGPAAGMPSQPGSGIKAVEDSPPAEAAAGDPPRAQDGGGSNRKRRKNKKKRAARQAVRRALKQASAEAEASAALDVPPARMRFRHWMLLASFLALVVLPLGATVTYLYTRAADQYHSEVAFSIRSEEATSATAGLLGALTQISSGTASEADILFQYIRSQKIIKDIDARLDLRAIYNKAENDPVFTLGADSTIERLQGYWRRMVDVSLESSAGIIQVRANAFTPEDARAVAREILAESSAVVNQLSDQAREDAVRFAREELDEAEKNLREVRQRLADFRREHRLVDPSADVAGQMGLMNAPGLVWTAGLVDRDGLLSFVGNTDQRVIQATRRIDAITAQIEQERAALSVGGTDGALPEIVGAYEELLVDIEFANTAYVQTLAGLAGARAEARRQSRYLAPHIQPTLAETALYPRRALITGLAALFLLLGWGMLMLIYYNVRDTR